MIVLLKVTVIWFSINVLIVATAWYATTIIPLHWPDWWKRVIIDDEPVPMNAYKSS